MNRVLSSWSKVGSFNNSVSKRFSLCIICILINSSTGWIKNGDLPEFKQFIEEPKQKRARRHKKYAREAVEADAIKKELDKKSKNKDSLEMQIMKRQSERESSSNNFFDRLLEKYGGDDDSEEYVFPAKKKKTTAVKKSSQKEPIHKVKSGRVNKKK